MLRLLVVAATSLLVSGTFVSSASARPPKILSASSLEPGTLELGFFDSYGRSVANVGDIDGNGVSDLAVGAPGDDDGGPDRGAVYILFLDAAGHVMSANKLSAAKGLLATELADGDRFGSAVAALGDVDGDGTPDLAAGAIGDDDGALDAGAVWAVTLTGGGEARGVRKLSAATPKLARVPRQWDGFGSAIVRLDDVDGNGFADLAVGASGSDRAAFNAGAVWILLLGDDLSVVRAQRLGDDASGLDSELPARGALGTSLAVQGGELLAGAGGDGTVFEPTASLWGFRLGPDGKLASHRPIAPTADAPNASGSAVPYGDFDFDGITDLAASVAADFDLLLLEGEAGVREIRTYRGYPFGDDLPWGPYDPIESLAVLPDLDGNLMPELVVGKPGAVNGQVWLLWINGESPEGASCGDPTGDDAITAADALYVLQAAVASRFCELLWCDTNASGRITAADALAVLQRAVVAEEQLGCPTTTTTTSTTLIIFDECFSNSDCHPDEPFCCGYTCCECDYDDSHCPEGEVCEGESCVPAP